MISNSFFKLFKHFSYGILDKLGTVAKIPGLNELVNLCKLLRGKSYGDLLGFHYKCDIMSLQNTDRVRCTLS